ncbi:MAG: reverse transcriptase family protein [Sedimenticola sp.]
MNGWNTGFETENYITRASCVREVDCDLIGIAETYLKGSTVLKMDGYTWYGVNRTRLHKNAKSGSGGVGFFIKNEMYNAFDISVLDDTGEDILWISLTHKFERHTICACVCYLPPENSTRCVDASGFYDSLLANVCLYQDYGTVVICGDLNGRCGKLSDFIEGVDNLPERDILDYTTNAHGYSLIDFLINSNMCILNGRNTHTNDFTSVSTKGLSVVDYCLVEHGALKYFNDFRVLRVSEVINAGGHTPTALPDHSLLTWCMVFDCLDVLQPNASHSESSDNFVKYDVSSIPGDFLGSNDVIANLHAAVYELETGLRTQSELDNAYEKLCSQIRQEMNLKLPHKSISASSTSNKKRRVGKPWWSDELTNLWNLVCCKEKKWINTCNRSDKIAAKAEYVHFRKSFSRNVQRAKRLHWYSVQAGLLEGAESNTNEFWRQIGKVGIANLKKKAIPMEVVTDDGDVVVNQSEVLNRWKHDFCKLYKSGGNADDNSLTNENGCDTAELCFNDNISISEVRKSVFAAKKGKASGVDQIPSDVFANDTAISFLHILFNVCFSTGTIPTDWGKGIINPIPKSSTNDPRDPMSYRGITLAPAMYKLYCYILNDRLSKWADENGKIAEEQNGFRRKRSTTDHIASLTNIIETRTKAKRSTYCAFVDFKKAFDSVDRDILWQRLTHNGIGGKMFGAIRSLYSSVSACVRVNSLHTDWFNVSTGLRQGCSLSPILFTLFINDLVVHINALDKGIDIGNDERVCILLYADDIVLIAETEDDLQTMLSVLGTWCTENRLQVNPTKSNVVHFRTKSTPKTNYQFMCNDDELYVTDRYVYLGLTLTEHLDFGIMAQIVSQSASRALGLLITKCKLLGGMPFGVYSKLYDSLVWPIVAYGAAIWGDRSYACINTVHNRAMRYYLGVGRYTPNAALGGEMGWTPPYVRQWKSVSAYVFRLKSMGNDRVNKRIFDWSKRMAGNRCKNWAFRACGKISNMGLPNIFAPIDSTSRTSFINSVEDCMQSGYIDEWKTSLNRPNGTRGTDGNKLRKYKLIKHEYGSEYYCRMIMSHKHRSAFCKFRCGVAPIRLETGRYENLPISERLCPFCRTEVEDEYHCLFHCHLYDDLRIDLVTHANALCDTQFTDLLDEDKFIFIFTSKVLIRKCAKTCDAILSRRTLFLYS